MRKRISVVALLLIVATLFCSCNSLQSSSGNQTEMSSIPDRQMPIVSEHDEISDATEMNEISVTEQPSEVEEKTSFEVSPTPSENVTSEKKEPSSILETDASENEEQSEVQTVDLITATCIVTDDYVSVSFDRSLIPPYSGSPYVDINWSGSDLADQWSIPKGYIYLSTYDDKGRCGSAIVHAVPDILPSGGRGSTGQFQPTGWVQNKYEGIVDTEPPYLYNRAHLLMWAFTGLTSTQENLMTGTRYLNAYGMQPTELEVIRYVQDGGELLYRVTPFFSGSNLLADGVLMEAVSQDGEFSVCRYAYNVQPGIFLDYATGDNHLEEKETVVESSTEAVTEAKYTYILNTNKHRFHMPECDSVKDIKETNKQVYVGTKQEVMSMGYVPCKNCKPDIKT